MSAGGSLRFFGKWPTRDVNPLQLLLKFVLAAVCISVFVDSSAHDFLEKRLTTKAYFSVRNALVKDQKLNHRLKIFSYDDSSFATLKAPNFKLKTWVEMLEALDRKNPEAIYIDQIFALTPESVDGNEALLERLRKIKAPIITAAFVTPHAIASRPLLNLAKPTYRVRDMFIDDRYLLTARFPPFTERPGWSAYGPSGELAPIMQLQGHVMNTNGGYVNALLRVTPREAIPHIGLIGKISLKIGDGRIFWNGRSVPMDRHGDVLPEYLPPRTYYQGSRRMVGLINDAAKAKDIAGLGAGDIVLVLPAMYTGSVDFTESPVGKLPGGFVIASMINSRLNESWFSFHETMHGIAWIGLIGALLSVVTPTVWMLPVLIATMSVTVLTCFGLFVWSSVVTSLSGSLFSVIAFSFCVILQKFKIFQRLSHAVRYLKDENLIMQSELLQANEISRVFVPVTTPRWDGYEIGVFHKPMMMGSGDWYTFEASASGKYLHYIMCDISGHGVQAAIIVSTCKTVMSMLVAEQPSLLESPDFIKKYCQVLNETLLKHGFGRHTSTLAAATFERDSSKVHLIVCGHPRPIHFQFDQNDKPRFVGVPSSIIGISEVLQINMRHLELNENDSLLLYTDGVEFPRVLSKILPFYRRYRHVDADTAAKFLVSDVRDRKKEFGGITPDDVSMVWFRKSSKFSGKKVS